MVFLETESFNDFFHFNMGNGYGTLEKGMVQHHAMLL